MGALLWMAAILVWMRPGFDEWVLAGHSGLRMSAVAAGVGGFVTRFGMSLIALAYLVYLPFAFRIAALRDARGIYPLVILLLGLVGLAGDALKEVIGRPRPYVALAGELSGLLVVKASSFPSGHATKSMALALPFLLFVAGKDRWHLVAKALILILTLGVCYSRILLGAHYLSDVLAGIGLAFLFAPAVTLGASRILRSLGEQELARTAYACAVLLAGLMVFLARA
jgi:undecaprenyl-diphosphatase